ncbi:integrin beta-2-like isoform X2 [Dendronephthya gigantea]|nr:integrin beta-2-like isoform X2 [Dendronephthya gigantea]
MENSRTQRHQHELSECENIKEEVCSLCLQIPGCSWCTLEDYEHARCDREENHINNGCPGNTVNPKQNVTVDEGSLVPEGQIFPKKVSLTARVGEPVTFTVNVRPVKNYPVDLYFLMDLSKTMQDDLSNLKSLAGNISIKLKELTNKRRLAFGSFVDKTVPPFVKQELINKSHNPNEEPSYNFRHVLDFTEKDKLFKETINKQTNSRSRDIPEATLDALMQVAACEKELGWNPVNTTRRIVLIATDAPFHTAGEGRFGGIAAPNDAKCHLTERVNGVRKYSGLEQDYPTVNQVFQKLRESKIQPIFAVSKYERKTFEQLAKTWEDLGSTYEELSADSNNIIELIERSYEEIVSTVRVTSQPPEDFDVKINSDCGDNIMIGNNICQGVGLDETVSFNISVTAKSCKSNSSSFKVFAAAFGEVEININTICSCDCDNEKEYRSTNCSQNGDLSCGGCTCSSGWYGKKCECESSRNNPSVINRCRRTNTSITVCEGNGDCVCNECKCRLIENTDQSYYGKYCQCSDLNCDKYEGKPCGGEERGVCKCGTCECKEGHLGSNCGTTDCSIHNARCLDTNGVNCSGHGMCICGKCRCDSFYEGDVCESCPTCINKCDDFKQCVLCKVFAKNTPNSSFCAGCPKVEILESLDELRKMDYPVTCENEDENECKYYFTYGKKRHESTITVYAVAKKDCPQDPDLLVIILGVVGGIVGIGIILLILWKLLTAMVDRNEYQKFKRERARSKWHREKNPLYQSPTHTVYNPIYTGTRQKRFSWLRG